MSQVAVCDASTLASDRCANQLDSIDILKSLETLLPKGCRESKAMSQDYERLADYKTRERVIAIFGSPPSGAQRRIISRTETRTVGGHLGGGVERVRHCYCSDFPPAIERPPASFRPLPLSMFLRGRALLASATAGGAGGDCAPPEDEKSRGHRGRAGAASESKVTLSPA